MDKEDFKEWFKNNFGVNGLGSGNYTYEDYANIQNVLHAMFDSQLGFVELSSLAEIVGDITDDEDLNWCKESIEELKLDQLEKAIR